MRKGRRLVLGGVTIPAVAGLAGHSDADALLHAVADALLGASALPDIGTLFPDTDADYRDAASAVLLKKVYARVRRAGYKVVNLDCLLVCDAPRIAPHNDAIRLSISRLLAIEPRRIGLKAKTTEGTMLAIPGKSIAALCMALLVRSR